MIRSGVGALAVPSVAPRPWPRTVAGALALAVVVWLLLALATDWADVAEPISAAVQSVEATSAALTRLFAALALALVPLNAGGRRTQWVAGGMLTLGLGHLVFGYLEPVLAGVPTSLNVERYEAFFVRMVAVGFFAAGLVPREPPRLTGQALIAITALLVLAFVVIFQGLEGRLPPVMGADPAGGAPWPGTPLFWLTGTLAVLATITLFGALRQYRRGNIRGWLLIAMVLWVGSTLHDFLAPASFTEPVLTSADVLRLAFTAVAAIGGIDELRRIAAERGELLAVEQRYSAQLAELGEVRASFNAMIAHELVSPVATIRNFVDVLGSQLAPDQQARILEKVRGETEQLDRLIADIRTDVMAEAEGFTVSPRPVPVSVLLDAAAGFASALPGNHPFEITDTTRGASVRADPERINQVLSNLIGNAAKYAPAGTPITLRAVPLSHGGRVRLTVADRGPGIHPDDVARIFNKFTRGRDETSRRVAGAGLGLYISRRIVWAHGGELTVMSPRGGGAEFSFDVEAVAV